jgi:hypothetical protein
MVLDLDLANSNIDTLTAGFESPRTYRIVVKVTAIGAPCYNTSCSAQVPAH